MSAEIKSHIRDYKAEIESDFSRETLDKVRYNYAYARDKLREAYEFVNTSV